MLEMSRRDAARALAFIAGGFALPFGGATDAEPEELAEPEGDHHAIRFLWSNGHAAPCLPIDGDTLLIADGVTVLTLAQAAAATGESPDALAGQWEAYVIAWLDCPDAIGLVRSAVQGAEEQLAERAWRQSREFHNWRRRWRAQNSHQLLTTACDERSLGRGRR